MIYSYLHLRREINLRDTHFNKGMSTGVDFNICVISPPPQ